MLSINAFEEELREEYGKIFSNIAEIKAAKKRRLSDNRPLSLSRSYTKEEKRFESKRGQQDSGEQEVIPEMINSRYGKIQVSEGYHETPVVQRTEGGKRSKARDKEVQEPSRHLLYDKVAMDLEAFFNKHMAMDSSRAHKSAALEMGKELDNIQNINVPRDEAQDTHIRYKTVHTKKDTLYIWIASV